MTRELAPKSRLVLKRVMVVGLATLVALVLAFNFFFPRAVQTLWTLGPKATRLNIGYVRESVSHLLWCNGTDRYASKLKKLEAEVATQEGVTDEKLLMARILVHTDRMDEGEALLRRLLEIEPQNPDTLSQLGQVLMRRAELQNCALQRSPCTYPLPTPHLDGSYAREANSFFQRALAQRETWSLRWLVHFSETAMGEADGLQDFAQVTVPVEPRPRLTELGVESGAGADNLGKGALLGDFDGDGLLDIVSGDQFGPLTYFRNEGGRRFSDRSVESGIAAVRSGFMQAAADVDNDGDLDLYVARDAFFGVMENVLLVNDGRGHFTDGTARAGIGNGGASFVTPFADYDLDGDLDLYVVNMSNPNRIGFAFDTLYGQHSNALYRNNGDGTFEEVTRSAGLHCIDSHLGASWSDFDGDGDPDLLATTYFGLNHLYENLGDGSFRDVAEELGVQQPWSSFSGWFFDHDGDLDLDLFVPSHAPTEVIAKYNMTNVPPPVQFTMRLFRNDGGKAFTDVTAEAGLQVAASAMGANWGDINGDGWPDFYIATGGPLLDRIEPNMLFVGRGDGTFWNATFATGTGHLQKGHGVSFGDLDGDGLQELHVGVGGAWPVDRWADLLYWNDTTYQDGRRPHAVKVVLRGRESNSHGVGAKVIVRVGERAILREIGGGGGFGVNPFLAEFGLGRAERVDSVEVRWPGETSGRVYRDLPVDVTLLIEEGAEAPLILESWVSSPMLGVPDSQLPSVVGAPLGTKS